MKLAEGLSLRADSQRRLEQVRQRLVRNALVQEGETPAEDPQALAAELERLAAALLDLMRRINRTNAATRLDDGASLADALALRDVLSMRQKAYAALAEAASASKGRVSRAEVIYRSTVNVPQIQRQADDLARDHRALDARIQELNWRTELLD